MKRRKIKGELEMDQDIARQCEGCRPNIEGLVNHLVSNCNGECKKENPRKGKLDTVTRETINTE